MRIKHRLFLFLFIGILVVFFFSWSLWYPNLAGLFNFSPFLENVFSWISENEVPLGLIIAAIGVLSPILIDRLKKPAASEKHSAFIRINSQELRNICRFSDVRWVDRGLMDRKTLELNHRIIITGASGVGKTREMVEQAILAEGKNFPRRRIFWLDTNQLKSSTNSEFDAEIQRLSSLGLLLICIDDLPRKLSSDDLEKLDRLMDFNIFPDILVIATARDDDLFQTEFPRWFEKKKFHPIHITQLTRDFIIRLSEYCVKDYKLNITGLGREVFIELAIHHQFTVYELVSILDYFQELQNKNPLITFDRDKVMTQMDQSKAAILNGKRAEFTQVDGQYSSELFESLAYFYASNLPFFKNYVYLFAADRLRQKNWLLRLVPASFLFRKSQKILSKKKILEVDSLSFILDEKLLEDVIGFDPAMRVLTSFMLKSHLPILRYIDNFRPSTTINQAILLYYQAKNWHYRENDDLAFNCIRTAISIINHPRSRNYLGFIYLNCKTGNRKENIEQAIVNFKLSLKKTNRRKYPSDWAEMTANLGNAYLNRLAGDRQQNIEMAIELYEQVLEVYTEQTYPSEWIKVTNNLGMAYSKRLAGDMWQNLQNATDLYDSILATNPQDSNTLYNKACVYAQLEDESRACNLLEQAIQQDSHYIFDAQTDTDFDSIRNGSLFQTLLQRYSSLSVQIP